MAAAIVNTAIAPGAAWPLVVPVGGSGGSPTESFSVLNTGTFVANSGSAVTVADTGVTANSIIIFTLKTVGGTVAAPFVATITPGTGFTANSGGSDTSTYNWLRIG